MDQLQKEEVVQAVLIADNFNDNFSPITQSMSAGLLPLVNTPLIDYSLEALNRSGVEEVFVFCSNYMDQVKKHIQEGISKKFSWSIQMSVQVVGSEGCRCLGDALRDLYAKGLIRGHFILLGCDTITNAQLGSILEQHKRTCKFDKGAAMTVVYKKSAPGIRTGDEVVVATEKDSNRLLFHQRVNLLQKERNFSFKLEMFLFHSEVVIRHDLTDPQLAICAPAALMLFADNFDFESRDDFIRGLLINEEILANTIYFTELPAEQYAAKVSNWQTYQLVSNDVINRWVYPLVPDMGICCLKQNYLFLRNNIYRSKDVQLARSGILKEDVVIREKCSVDAGTVLSYAVLGVNCKIGKNCILNHAFLFDNVTVADNCTLKHCVIGSGASIEAGVTITDGAVIGDGVIITANSKVLKYFVQSTEPEDEEGSVRLGDRAFAISDKETINEPDSDDEDDIIPSGIVRMSGLECNYPSSVYSSSSDGSESRHASPVPEDSNIFLSEVIDSLNRGYQEKSNPDFLILEINSSRYAYNMSLTEVNFFVVKAVLSLQPIVDGSGANVLTAFNQILSHLGPVFKNYIRGEDAMRDCLKAIAECCSQDENLRPKIAQIIHYLYDKEILSEDAILAWHNELDDDDDAWLKAALKKLVDWLMTSSDEESSSDDE